MTSFPLINLSAGQNFTSAWHVCDALTSFPAIDMPAGTNFTSTWQACPRLTSFPLIDMSAGQTFNSTWQSCSGLTSFPLINTAAGTNFDDAWKDCSGLNNYDFPTINMRGVTSAFSCFSGVTLSTGSYSALLIDLALGATTNVWFAGGLSKYSAGAVAARDALMPGRAWTIADGGLE